MTNNLSPITHLFQDTIDWIALWIAVAVEAAVTELCAKLTNANLIISLAEIRQHTKT